VGACAAGTNLNDEIVTAQRQFVSEPPRPSTDQVDAILLLDVDGVLNILGNTADRSTLPTVPGSGGRPLPIHVITGEILDVLELTVSQPGTWLGWLSTWGFSVSGNISRHSSRRPRRELVRLRVAPQTY
jgi:hypothetical protein